MPRLSPQPMAGATRLEDGVDKHIDRGRRFVTGAKPKEIAAEDGVSIGRIHSGLEQLRDRAGRKAGVLTPEPPLPAGMEWRRDGDHRHAWPIHSARPLTREQIKWALAILEETVIPDTLDAAWTEVEGALPEGWIICRLLGSHPMPYGQPWSAQAEPTPAYRSVPGHMPGQTGSMWLGVGADGPTPAAALRALAAKLRAHDGPRSIAEPSR